MNKYRTLIFCILLIVLSLKGQINTYSPYSYFGVGELYNSSSVSNVAMGGFGLTTTGKYSINNINPSSYSFLDLTCFELGFRSSFIDMSQGNLEQNNFVSGLFNLGLGFPISNNVGFSIGLSPYSAVGYSVTSREFIHDDIGFADYNFSGSGGLNKILVGAGWEVVSANHIDISVGANLNYFFGGINEVNTVATDNSQIKFREEIESVVGDYNVEMGVLLNYWLSDYKFSIGATLTPEKSIASRTNIFQHTYISSGDYESLIDTILYVPANGNNDYITLPIDYSIGFSLESTSKWLIGLDYNFTNWESSFQSTSHMRNQHRFILGGQFIPKKDDIHNYFNRVEYKLGFSYASGYLNLGSTAIESNFEDFTKQDAPLNDWSVSAGMSLPMNRVYSRAHIGLRYGYRGYPESGFITENYFTVYLSMTLNEKWFKKRKIE